MIKKTSVLSSVVLLNLLSFANGQVFELEHNPSVSRAITITANPTTPSITEEDEVIVDKSSDEIIVPAQALPQVDKWMGIVQAKERDYVLIEHTLQNGQNANQGIFEGSSMLHLAAWQNDEKLFRLGLQYGGILSNTNKNGETVLHWAAYSKNPNIINLAFSDKSSLKIINKQNKTGRTALHFNALQWGNLEVAKALISQKADLNIKDVNGQTPLHYALASRKWNLAKLYIDSGADTSLKDKNNEGLDEYILSKGDIDVFKLFYSNLTPTTQELIKAKLTHLNLAP